MIDYHTHIGEAHHYGESFLAEAVRMRGSSPTLEIMPEEHRQAMEGASRVIVLAFRSRHLGFEVPNEYVAEYCQADPEKMIGFASVDPHDADALDELKHCHVNLGLRGLKTSPIYQAYDPMDPRMLRIYRYCEDNGLPILTHHGTTFPRTTPVKWAHPQQLEDVLLAFPELRVIIAHLGHPWETETIALLRKHPHLYSDISGLFYRPFQLYSSLTLCREYGVLNKLLFGTDFPVTTIDETVKGLYKIVEYAERMPFPSVTREDVGALIERDVLPELGLG